VLIFTERIAGGVINGGTLAEATYLETGAEVEGAAAGASPASRWIPVQKINDKGRSIMSEKIIVAVPSVTPGGMNAEASGHFGHCDVFTLVTIEDGEIGDVSLHENVEHAQGGCLAPVAVLASKRVDALIAGGMGMRPLIGFNDAGIEVFFNNGLDRVGSIIEAFVQGRLPRFSRENVCGGGGAGGCGGH